MLRFEVMFHYGALKLGVEGIVQYNPAPETLCPTMIINEGF